MVVERCVGNALWFDRLECRKFGKWSLCNEIKFRIWYSSLKCFQCNKIINDVTKITEWIQNFSVVCVGVIKIFGDNIFRFILFVFWSSSTQFTCKYFVYELFGKFKCDVLFVRNKKIRFSFYCVQCSQLVRNTFGKA